MKDGQGAYIQGYNCQAAVDDAHQVIVAASVSNLGPDNGHLIPMLEQTVDNCGQAPQKMSADSGYWHPDVPAEAAEQGTETFIASETRKASKTDPTVTAGPPPSESTAREAMRHKLRTPEGREVYARRKAIVEPVHGQQKEARGFRRFLLRGMRKVQGEFELLCTGHNLLKLYRAQMELAGQPG